MTVTCRSRAVLISLATAVVVGSTLAAAQDSTCTYDRCALRLQHRLWSLRLVAGANDTPVARLGMFAPRIAPLSGAGDSVRSHYEAFRSSQNRASAFALVGIVTIFASGVVYGANRYQNDGVALGLAVAALPFAIVGAVNELKARDHLAQAIWLYNRALPRTP